jgi:glycosyltransferase involved in cell wall biosynthesis
MRDFQRQRQSIEASGLFDSQFYTTLQPPAKNATLDDPLAHFLSAGAAYGYDPHPLFDTSFYVETYPEVASSGLNPLYHYLTAGSRSNYWPHPLFDPDYYRRLYAGRIPAGVSPLEHYARARRPNLLTTHALFDMEYYGLAESRRTETTTLAYYLLHWREDTRSPHPCFDLEYYAETYPEARAAGYDPISHFLVIGWRSGYNPHPLFDCEFYLRHNPDVRAAGLNPLLHYLAGGASEGRDPHPWFDSSYYLEHNADVVESGKNPLAHYIMAGEREDRPPHPLFRPHHWAAARGVAAGSHKVLVQFVGELEQGAHPLATLGLRARPRRPLAGRPGVNLVGWPRLEIGVGENLREVARSLAAAAVEFGIRDVSLGSAGADQSVTPWIRRDAGYHTNLFVMNADNMTESCMRLGFEDLADRFNIACWVWELAEFPAKWRTEMCLLDEIWAASSFVQKAISLAADIPVVFAPQPVTLPAGARFPRARFAIPEDRFVFFFQFDFTAFVERKNPYAAIAAFRRAFPGRSAPVVLVIKTNHSERYPEEMRKLLDAAANDPNIILIHGTLPRDKVVSLLAAADTFISLHRSEGFGRSLAEAMLLGKPVIGTNYSGNTDFMTAENSCPVNYTLVPVLPGQYPCAEGQVWAEPDMEHAAWYMRRLVRNRDYREMLSRAARKTIANHYSSEATGAHYLRRLQTLGLYSARAGIGAVPAGVGH